MTFELVDIDDRVIGTLDYPELGKGQPLRAVVFTGRRFVEGEGQYKNQFFEVQKEMKTCQQA